MKNLKVVTPRISAILNQVNIKTLPNANGESLNNIQ